MRGIAALLTVGGLMVFATTAKADSRADTKAQACEQYGQVDSALTSLKQMSGNSSIGDFHAAEQRLESSYNTFSKTASQVAKPETEKLDQSIRHLAQTTNNLPPEATVDQANAMIKGDIANIQVSRTQLLNTLGCPYKAQRY